MRLLELITLGYPQVIQALPSRQSCQMREAKFRVAAEAQDLNFREEALLGAPVKEIFEGFVLDPW
jgi:hypothetical protein